MVKWVNNLRSSKQVLKNFQTNASFKISDKNNNNAYLNIYI